MTDHDPLCKQRFDPYQPPCPECEILATGRADERAKQPRVEIEAALGEPMTCKVWVDGSLVFSGIDLASATQGINGFPPHVHMGDYYDPDHCVYTRADGERCMEPLNRSSE